MKILGTIITDEKMTRHYDSVKNFRNCVKVIKENKGKVVVARYSKINKFGRLDEPVYIIGNAVDEYKYMRK